MADINIEELVSKVLSSVKGKPDMLANALKDTSALQKLIPNVKLDASQLNAVTAMLKKNAVVKELLGADGKLDVSDVARLAKKVTGSDAKDMLGKAAGLLGKK